jgi:pyrroloquinoline-quinone synthase
MKPAPLHNRALVASLQRVGQAAYHDKHPFHMLMNQGRLDKKGIQIWVINRFYYQAKIPVKDAAILSNCPVREVRRLWLHRITDHDGLTGDEGGIGAWVRLGQACGISEKTLLGEKQVLPGVRFAVDAYVNFARTQPWPIAVASSLTEMFAPDLMLTRLNAFERHYPWIEPAGLEYFKSRLTQARRDSDEALRLTIKHANTPGMRAAFVNALQFKCDVLWAMLDAIHAAATRQIVQSEFSSKPTKAMREKKRHDD